MMNEEDQQYVQQVCQDIINRTLRGEVIAFAAVIVEKAERGPQIRTTNVTNYAAPTLLGGLLLAQKEITDGLAFHPAGSQTSLES